MSAPVSRPRYPGSRTHGLAYKPVTVLSTNLKERFCIVRDSYGATSRVRCDIMRAKGNLPEPGEIWYIDRQYDIWVFAAILNGRTDGVAVDNVTNLPESIQKINDDRAAGDALIKAQTLGKISAKGDILAATQGETVERLPAGALNQALVADPNTTTGLAYRDLCGRPVGFSGLTGALAAGRWVGHTSSGPPTSGSFLIGDWVQARNGYTWVCSLAGSPGTWVSRSDAVEQRVAALEGSGGGARIVSRSRITASTLSVRNQALTTGTGFIRTFGEVKAGRLYRIGTPNLQIAADNAPLRVWCGLRISTDGSNTNTGGSLVQQSGSTLAYNSTSSLNRPEQLVLQTFFTPSVDCILSCSIVPSAHTTVGGEYPDVWIFASSNMPCDNYIEDLGPDPGA